MDNSIISYIKTECVRTAEHVTIAIDTANADIATDRLTKYQGAYEHAIIEPKTLEEFVTTVLSDLPHEVVTCTTIKIE